MCGQKRGEVQLPGEYIETCGPFEIFQGVHYRTLLSGLSTSHFRSIDESFGSFLFVVPNKGAFLRLFRVSIPKRGCALLPDYFVSRIRHTFPE